MSSQKGGKAPSMNMKAFSLGSFIAKLKKRHIIETFAGFIAGGWLFLEFVDRILIAHYELNKKWLDISFTTLLGALLCIILWRWFSGIEKRPGNVKVEILVVPLVILVTLAIDLNLIFQIAGIPPRRWLISVIAFLLGTAWVVFKSLRWAVAMPETGKREVLVPPLSTARPEKSIIVLPFTNISPEEGQDYFCDGMTEEIITDLSHVHDLLVISRSSAMTFKGTKKTIPEIAQAVNVRYVLEGSARKAGNSIRIAAQLIDPSTDAHLWADKYTGTLDDVFDIQEKVSRAIVEALKLKLSSAELHKMAARPIDNARAYECYLRARAEVLKLSSETIERSLQYLQNALEIVGESAVLYSGMAWAYWMQVNIGAEHEERLEKAEEFARRALALDSESALAHAMLGWIAVFRDIRRAVHHFRKALSINADDTVALQGLTMVDIQYIGKIDAAELLLKRLIQIDPFDFPTKWFQGGIYFYNGQYDLALRQWQVLSDESPKHPAVRLYHALTKASLGQMKDVLSIIAEGEGAPAKDIFTRMGLLLRHAILKNRERVFQELTAESQKTFRRDAAFGHHLAGILALLEEKDLAFDWLQNAIDHGFINYPLLAERDPLLSNIRGEPRFKKLMERVKYEWEHFEV